MFTGISKLVAEKRKNNKENEDPAWVSSQQEQDKGGS